MRRRRGLKEAGIDYDGPTWPGPPKVQAIVDQFDKAGEKAERGRGMKGTVIKRGSKWSVVIDAGHDAEGKRIRKWHSGHSTRREAEAARIEILSRIAQGFYVERSKVTVDEWLRGWLEGRQGIAATTRVGYQSDVKRIARGPLGQVRLQSLTPMMVSAWYADLVGAYSPKTIRNTHTTLSRALKDAVRSGVVVRNAAQDAELPKLERPDSPAWTDAELRTFLDHLSQSGHRLYGAWQLACSTGMRRSELLGLRGRTSTSIADVSQSSTRWFSSIAGRC